MVDAKSPGYGHCNTKYSYLRETPENIYKNFAAIPNSRPCVIKQHLMANFPALWMSVGTGYVSWRSHFVAVAANKKGQNITRENY